MIPLLELFRSVAWPGNIRQMVNALERAKILADDPLIELHNLPPEILKSAHATDCGQEPAHAAAIGDASPMESISKLHITEVLRRNHGNKANAARELGIARRSLYRMLERFDT